MKYLVNQSIYHNGKSLKGGEVFDPIDVGFEEIDVDYLLNQFKIQPFVAQVKVAPKVEPVKVEEVKEIVKPVEVKVEEVKEVVKPVEVKKEEVKKPATNRKYSKKR